MSFQFAATSLAIPIYVAQEEVEVGQRVLRNFIHEEFRHEHITDEITEVLYEDEEQNQIVEEGFPEEIQEYPLDNVHGAPEMTRQIALTGMTIRNLATEFQRSRQRREVQREADEVDLSAINRESFWTLLEEVFRDGVNHYNLVALFFFCSDVLIRCVRLRMQELGMSLFRWALTFIAERVCDWVHRNGGWENALKKAVRNWYKYFAGGFIVVGVLYVGYRGLTR